jgi:hypothetical protein
MPERPAAKVLLIAWDSAGWSLQRVRVSCHVRTLFNIPIGVFHAVKNMAYTEAVFINMPTRPYNHAIRTNTGSR